MGSQTTTDSVHWQWRGLIPVACITFWGMLTLTPCGPSVCSVPASLCMKEAPVAKIHQGVFCGTMRDLSHRSLLPGT